MSNLRMHVGQGIWINREADGSVRVRLMAEEVADPDEAAPKWERTISPHEWASVVASMSREGETWQTWHDAVQRQVP